jgi:hypothetical protein
MPRMSADPFHLNRPVHLARRDAFYDQAATRIRKLSACKSTAEQQTLAGQALYLLREARRHAEVANLSEKTSSHSRLFVRFMDLIVDNTQSLALILSRQIHTAAADNPLDAFLGGSGASSKMSSNYRRCAVNTLKGLLYLLQQAEKPLQNLRQTSLVKMTADDQQRYEKARKHFEELADGEAEKASEFPDL